MYIDWRDEEEPLEHGHPTASDSEPAAQPGHRAQDSALHQGHPLRIYGSRDPRLKNAPEQTQGKDPLRYSSVRPSQ